MYPLLMLFTEPCVPSDRTSYGIGPLEKIEYVDVLQPDSNSLSYADILVLHYPHRRGILHL